MLGDFKKTFRSVGDQNPKQTFEGLNRAYRGFPLKSAQATSMILLEEYLFLTGSLMHE